MSTQPKDVSGQQPNYERVDLAAQIIHCIGRLKDRRSAISVDPRSGQAPRNSTVLNLNIEQSYMVIDQLAGGGADTLLEKGQTVRIRSMADGVEVVFQTKVMARGAKNGTVLYKLALPSKIYQLQRREHYRVAPGVVEDISVTIKDRDGSEYQGRLMDISASGVGVRFRQRLPEHFVPGHEMPECTVEMHNGTSIRCAVQIRRVDTERLSRPTMGAQFVNLSRAQEHAIERFVAALDREQRKQRKMR